MLPQSRLLLVDKPLTQALVVLGLLVLATALRFLGLPSIGAGAPFVTYTPAVFAVFLFLGRWAGRWCLVGGAVAGYVLFAAPYGVLAWKPVPFSSLVVMAACGLMLDYALEGQRRATTRLYGVLASLRESEQRYFGMVNDQAEAIGRTDSEGCVVFVNEAFCQLLGVSRLELLGKPWHLFVASEDRNSTQRQVGRLTPERSVVILENRFRNAAGEVRWGRFVNRGIFRGDGRLLEVETLAHDITDRKALEQQLRTTTAELRDLYDNAPCAYYALDEGGKFLHLNTKTEEWLGCPSAEMVGRLGPVDFVTPEGREQFLTCFPVFKQTGIIDGLEFDLTSRQGVTRRVLLHATAIYDGMGRFLQSRSVMHDITDLYRAQQRLQALAAEQRAILDNEIVGMVKARGGHAVWRNRAVETMFGFSASELQTHGSRLLYASDAEFQEVKQQAAAVLRTGQRFHTQVRLVRTDGSRLWVDLSASRVGSNAEVIWSFVDITPLVMREEQARFMAHRDVLTGLPNRRQFDTSAAEILAEARTSGQQAALCYLDLDGFKPVNDLHGHAAGDLLLQEMARRMTQCLRGRDVVFRFGGDEFVLLLPQVKDGATCSMVLARLLAAIEQEVKLPTGVTVRVTGSIGAALLGEAGDSLAELLQAADSAMYVAKQSAGSSLQFATRKQAANRLAALT